MKKMNWMAGVLVLGLAGGCLAADQQAAGGDSGFRLGVEGGINLANLRGDNVDDVFASRLGWVGGAFLDLPIGTTLAIQPEVLYEQKGGKFNGNPYQLDYVEVPILLNVSLLGPLAVLLGPAFDSRVDSRGVVNVTSGDVGLVLGVQLNLSRFLLSGRYEAGLNDIRSDQKIQNGTFTFLAGISLL